MQPKFRQAPRKESSDAQRAKNKTQGFYIITFCMAHFLSPLLMWCMVIPAVIIFAFFALVLNPKSSVPDIVFTIALFTVIFISAAFPLVVLWRRFARKINDPQKLRKAHIPVVLSFAYHVVALIALTIVQCANPTNPDSLYIPVAFMFVVMAPFMFIYVPTTAPSYPGTGPADALLPWELTIAPAIFLLFMYLVIALTLIFATRKLEKSTNQKKGIRHDDPLP